MYRYKVEYESGREFLITSDEVPAVFIKCETGGDGKVKKIFRSIPNDAGEDKWFEIYPGRY